MRPLTVHGPTRCCPSARRRRLLAPWERVYIVPILLALNFAVHVVVFNEPTQQRRPRPQPVNLVLFVVLLVLLKLRQ
jgi:hypothetical protein